MAAIPSFIFGAGTKYKTQEELDRAREQVKALLGDIGESKFTGWGSALADLGKGISAGIEGRRINEGQEIVSADQERLWNSFPDGGGYGGAGDSGAVDPTETGSVGGDIDTGAGAPSVDLSGDKAAFVAALMPAAVEHGARIGVDPRIIVAQAAQETGWGKHAPNNNYFGIKSHGKGGGQTFATNEVINGKRVRINDSFRKFNSPADSVAGYADFLASNKRYGAMRSAQGLDNQLRALGASGYATDPNYAASVGAIARSLPLTGVSGPRADAGVNRGVQVASLDPAAGLNEAFAATEGDPRNTLRPGPRAASAGGSFLQAKPNRRRMTPAMLEQEAGTEARPLWNDSPLAGRRRMTPAMTGIPDAVQPAPPAAPSPLDGRRRMTPAMINPAAAPAPAPLPAPDPARFGPTPPVPVAAPLPAPNPDRFAPAAFVPPAPQIFTPPAAPRGDRLGNPPPSMAGTETAPYPVPGNSMAGTETAPSQFTPTPARMPAPIARVDPFTDMILGDKAAQFRPGNVSPPMAPGVAAGGLQAARQALRGPNTGVDPITTGSTGAGTQFPAAPPAQGTPAAAGFGVPPVVGGGGADRLAGKGTFPPAPAPPQAQQAAGGITKIGKLMHILASPNATPEMKRMAAAMLDREYALEDERRKAAADAANPLTQLQLQKAQLEIDKLKKGETPALMNAGGGNIYNPATGEWIQAPAGPGGGGPFSGESVEAQALNGLVANGTLTAQQAYDLAAGKAITNPEDGSLVWMTPQGLVGGPPGQPPKLIVPAGGGNPAPQGTSAAAPAPAGTAPAGGRQITGGKPGKMATEAETRARALYSVASPEMKIVEQLFPALSNIDDQIVSKLPWGSSNWATSEDFQRGKNALMSIIQTYMYVTSGQSAPDQEVERNAVALMPQPGEKPGTIKDKLGRIQNYVRAIKMAGGQGEETAPAAGGGGNTDYKTIYGLE